MAKVISFIKFSGTIDGVTFRKTAEGNIAGRKTGPSRERVLYDEDFDQTRRNAGEFKLAVKDAKLLRQALDYTLDGVKRTTLNGHVTGLLYAAAMQDPVHELGCRYGAAGDIGAFEGFEFGHQLRLDGALPASFVHHLNAASGSMKVEVPSFIARKRKDFPAAATHFRIVSAGAAINFAKGRYVNDIKKSALLPLRKQTPEAISLDHSLTTGPGDVVVQVLGIQFYTLVNGEEVLVKGGAVKILAAELVTEEIPVLVDVPLVEATPFTAKRLQWLWDGRREGRVASGEKQVGSGEVVTSTDNPFALVENPAPVESVRPVDDAAVGCVEMIPLMNHAKGLLPDRKDVILTDDFITDELPVLDEHVLADEHTPVPIIKPFTIMPFRLHIDKRIRRWLRRRKARNCEFEALSQEVEALIGGDGSVRGT
jgi:hypothetical protein